MSPRTLRKKPPAFSDCHKRDPSEAKTKFEKWVLTCGKTKTIAKLLGINQLTVINWIKKRRTPSLKNTADILKLADGELTFTDIVKGTMA